MFGYSKLKRRIEDLEDTVGALRHQLNNPPVHKVGDIIEGSVITDVKIKAHRLSDIYGNKGKPYMYSWVYEKIIINK